MLPRPKSTWQDGVPMNYRAVAIVVEKHQMTIQRRPFSKLSGLSPAIPALLSALSPSETRRHQPLLPVSSYGSVFSFYNFWLSKKTALGTNLQPNFPMWAWHWNTEVSAHGVRSLWKFWTNIIWVFSWYLQLTPAWSRKSHSYLSPNPAHSQSPWTKKRCQKARFCISCHYCDFLPFPAAPATQVPI